ISIVYQLPDLCSKFFEVRQRNDDDKYIYRVNIMRPKETICAQQITLDTVDVSFLPGDQGIYTLVFKNPGDENSFSKTVIVP
ncbi:MAG: hypothetical protein ACOCVN_02050, partial [bacterium]